MILTWKTEVLGEKTFPLSMLTINTTLTSLGLNLDLNSERLVTNCLSHGMTAMVLLHISLATKCIGMYCK